MPEYRTCDFSGEEIEPGTGIMYVHRDGTVLHFKNSKAEKNYFMDRDGRELEWTYRGDDEEAGEESDAADAEDEGAEE
jgi:large subunit ribosomal protein L24e